MSNVFKVKNLLVDDSILGNINVSGDIYSNAQKVIVSDDVDEVVKLTKTEYDAITPEPSTLYIISDEEVNAPLVKPLRTANTNTSITDFDYTLLLSGNITGTLPAASSNRGYVYNIKNIGTGTITIDTNGGTIDGSGSHILSTQYESITVQSDSLNWHII